MVKSVIIDTDPGIDDAAALMLALASPELSVEAITTVYGNGPIDASTRNALIILDAAGRLDIPVYEGARKPLLRLPTPGWASQVHGVDALGNTNWPVPEGSGAVVGHHAALEIIERVMARPGEITLLALGRLTNVALALSLEPDLAGAVAKIVVMGGTIYQPGNVSPTATANLHEDPEAAAIVYNSGAPLAQVGLDVCNPVEITPAQLAQIEQAGLPTTGLLTAATPHLQAYYNSQNLLQDPRAARYNDLPAVAYAVQPELFQTRHLPVRIETGSGLTQGQTVADLRPASPNPANVHVCLEVDAEGLADLFTQRICGYSPPNQPGLSAEI